MTLKDWKLRHKSFGFVNYVSSIGEVIISKKYPDNKPTYWEVKKSYGIYSKPFYEKFTKFNNALVHAKSYMKSH